ncbi:hypothetical protein VPH35_073464 [Triticum aestivum]
MGERERRKERREALRRTGEGHRPRRGQVRPGGWWRLDPLLDPSSSTSPLPNTKEEGWPRKRARTRGLKRVFLRSSPGQGRGRQRGVEHVIPLVITSFLLLG